MDFSFFLYARNTNYIMKGDDRYGIIYNLITYVGAIDSIYCGYRKYDRCGRYCRIRRCNCVYSIYSTID